MNRSLMIIGLIALSWAVSAGNRDITRCYSLGHDKRNACLAEAKRDRSGCASIKAPDKRHICEAKTSGSKTPCYAIRLNEDRASCLAGMDW